MKQTNQFLRLAFRKEGAMWNAYAAKTNSMDEAILIGSIAVSSCHANPEIKNRFMELMKDTFTEALQALGINPLGYEMQGAPEHEKGGNA